MRRRTWYVIVFLAAAIATIQLPRAYAIYFHLSPWRNGPGQVDLGFRWQEIQYILRHKNPFDVAFANDSQAHAVQPASQAFIHRPTRPDRDLGVPGNVAYPPWSYVTALPFFWMRNLRHEAVYYACIMAFGLGVMFWWAQSELRDAKPLIRAAVGFSTLAAAAWVSGIVAGNNPLIVVPLLALFGRLLGLRKEALAGVLLGMAMLKPTLALPFCLILVFSYRWKALSACVSYMLLASLVTWYFTGTSPIEMLGQMSAATTVWVDRGFGPVQYLIHAGIPPHQATVFTAVLVLSIGGWVLWSIRNASLLAQFSIAAITARFWSYHLHHDDAVLTFLVVYFARETLVHGSRIAGRGFVLSCIALWLPYRATLLLPVQIVQLSIWLVLGYWVVRLSKLEAKQSAKTAINVSDIAVPQSTI